jgi:hypothetical protein
VGHQQDERDVLVEQQRQQVGNQGTSSSAERWDAHKNPRPTQAGGIDDDDGQSNSNGMELDDVPLQRTFYAGPGFLASSPEPSMLPMPSPFMVRVAA